MNIIKLSDHRKVFINPNFKEMGDHAKKHGWKGYDTFLIWLDETNVKVIMRRTG